LLFFHQAVRRGGVPSQFRGCFKRRDPVHLFTFEQSRSPLAHIQNAASGHCLAMDEISDGEKTGAVSALDVGFGEPFEIEVAPEEAGDLRHGFRGGGYRLIYFDGRGAGKARGQHPLEERVW
jgi:hypothetical protein